jgi:hypothetical protein
MGFAAIILPICGAILAAAIDLGEGDTRVPFGWLITGIGAAMGASVASEFLGPAGAWGPAFDGMVVVPALIGGAIAAGIIAVLTRTVTRPAGAAT